MMSVSGHKTEAQFLKYVKLSLDEYADCVASVAADGFLNEDLHFIFIIEVCQ